MHSQKLACQLTALVVVALWASLTDAADQWPQRPNVLFLIADDYCTALQCYGREQCRTPNLDRLARQGVRFENAYCQFSVCGPSRASLMCGMYPAATGVLRNGGDFRRKLPDHVTLPQLFKNHGYWAARVSKIYHMGIPGDILLGTDGADDAASWDERYNVKGPEMLTPGKAEDCSHKHGGDVTDDIPAARKLWFAGKATKRMLPAQGSDFVVVEAANDDSDQPDYQAASKAIELLHKSTKDDQPFFLAVGFVRPHVPLVAPGKWFAPFDVERMKLPEQVAGDLDDLPPAGLTQTNAVKYGMSELQSRKVLRAYYASVAFMDAQVGRILDELDRLKLRDNTIVVFTSDHGYHLGEHTMWQKLSAYEEGSKVPLIVSAPGQKARDGRCGRIVELVDLYPTLADLAGLEVPQAVQGSSFRALLDDVNAAGPKPDAHILTNNAAAIRTERYKYIEFAGPRGGIAMFDLENDPHEFTNLAGKPDHAEQQMKLRERLAEVRRQSTQPGPRK